MHASKLVLIAMTAAVYAADTRGTEFDFTDPKKVNSMSIYLDSELEPITGTASGISGSMRFDPENPAATTARIIVDAASIQMTNPKMTEVLHSPDWIDVKKNSTVAFAISKVRAVERKGENRYEVTFHGTFTLNGISREMDIPATLSYLPGKLKARNSAGDGDLLIVRTQFSIDRVDFGIKPDAGFTHVARKINIQAGIVGFAVHGD